MILTVAINAAFDITYGIGRVEWHGVNYLREVRTRTGGKAVNVARTLQALGMATEVIGLAGGGNGHWMREELARSGLRARLVEMKGESRRTVTVVDDARGDATLFLEPGPQIAHEEWEALVTIYLDRLAHAKAVVLAGSLPPGVPVDAYRQLGELATKAGVPVVLDAVGEALTWGLHARPQLVKPNLSELEGFAGNRLNTEPDKLQAVEAMLEVGAEAVVVSLGDEGLLAVTIEGRWRVQPSERLTGNPTGAGDAVVSALTLGMIRGTSWPKRLADACALSMAAVKAPEAGEFDDKAYRHYQQLVRVTSF